jgi:uncharacterized protein (DUF433 family)
MSTTVRIVKTPDVLHGRPRIEGTRVGVFTLGAAVREHDESLKKLLGEYPDLDRKEIKAAIDYYDDHPELMDYIRTQKPLRKQDILEQSRAPAARSDADS